jgi:type 2 lantibiotic biosynthesis protein LanM
MIHTDRLADALSPRERLLLPSRSAEGSDPPPHELDDASTEPVRQHLDHGVTLPAWHSSACEAFVHDRALHTEPILSPRDLAFVGFCEPFLAREQGRLVDAIRAHSDSFADTNTILSDWQSEVLFRASELCSRALVLEMHILKQRHGLPGDTPEARYLEFERLLGTDTHRRRILLQYPVLGRMCTTIIHNSVSSLLELMDRLAEDSKDLERAFGALGRVSGLSTGCGDPHREGRSVCELHFESGRTIMYKPRPMAPDECFQRTLRWASQRIRHHHHEMTVLDRASYGWCEHVERATSSDPEAIARYYWRSGSLLALLYFLGGSDIHNENVIARGEFPVLIDLETLVGPRLSSPSPNSKLAESVLTVGLLPWRIELGVGRSATTEVSVGGLDPVGDQLTPIAVPVWKNQGTDELRLEREYLPLPQQRNLPYHYDFAPDEAMLTKSLIDGFTETYSAVCRDRADFLTHIEIYQRCSSRVVLRPTFQYCHLTQESMHPQNLGHGHDLDAHFDQLWTMSRGDPDLERVVDSEKEQLWSLDVPVFCASASDRGIRSHAGDELFEAHESGMDGVRRRVRGASAADLGHQHWLIRVALARACSAPHESSMGRLLARHRTAAVDPLEIGLTIAQEIVQRGFSVEGMAGASWLGLHEEADGDFAPVVLGDALYDGGAGIALFLLYASEFPGGHQLAAATDALVTGCLERMRNGGLGPGLFSGRAGGLYLATVAHHLGRLDLEVLRATAPGTMADQVLGATGLDVIDGAAGCMLSLLVYHEVFSDDVSLEIATRLGERIRCEAHGWMQAGADASFAHGLSGVLYALLRLSEAEASPSAGTDRAFLGELVHETLCALSSQELSTTWCRGVSGITMALTKYVERMGGVDERTSREVERAMRRQSDAPLPTSDCLCHGTLGLVDLLATSREQSAHGRVDAFLASVLDRASAEGWSCGIALEPETPGLMTGLAGIGYQLLRHHDPSFVPSILRLEAPGRRSA